MAYNFVCKLPIKLGQTIYGFNSDGLYERTINRIRLMAKINRDKESINFEYYLDNNRSEFEEKYLGKFHYLNKFDLKKHLLDKSFSIEYPMEYDIPPVKIPYEINTELYYNNHGWVDSIIVDRIDLEIYLSEDSHSEIRYYGVSKMENDSRILYGSQEINKDNKLNFSPDKEKLVNSWLSL